MVVCEPSLEGCKLSRIVFITLKCPPVHAKTEK